MNRTRQHRRGVVTRDATGSGSAEAFVLIAIATILITRLYLELTGYPQIGGVICTSHTPCGVAR